MNSRTLVGLLGVALIGGSASAQSTQAVEWKKGDGGNGHWYQLRRFSSVISWTDAEAECRRVGGHLATIHSEAEDVFVFSVANTPLAWQGYLGPWLGGMQLPNSGEPVGVWVWCTGEPWTYVGPDSTFPNNGGPGGTRDENRLHYIDFIRRWNDIPEDGDPGNGGGVRSMLVEWDADCNGDGLVDYGQILSGQLADDNANGVPDICETSVTGVTPPSVPSQGGSTVTIKGNNLPENPSVQIGGLPATDVVRVSATRITATSPALLPGMVSVTVNGFTLQEALYIRPECGSDLDQDGEVTAADIAIVLLDFGPCYVSAAPNPAEDSRPFMLREEAAAAAPRSR